MKILSVKQDSNEIELKRQKLIRRTKIFQIIKLILFCGLIFTAGFFAFKSFRPNLTPVSVSSKTTSEIVKPRVPITDENRQPIPDNILDFAGKLERELTKSGLKVEKFIIPSGKTRELQVWLAETKHFYKTNTDRNVGETAEDIVRMSKHITEHKLENLTYLDVRISGRAYYK